MTQIPWAVFTVIFPGRESPIPISIVKFFKSDVLYTKLPGPQVTRRKGGLLGISFCDHLFRLQGALMGILITMTFVGSCQRTRDRCVAPFLFEYHQVQAKGISLATSGDRFNHLHTHPTFLRECFEFSQKWCKENYLKGKVLEEQRKDYLLWQPGTFP